MSPKLRQWLLIGGGVLVGLILLCLVATFILGALGPSTGNVFSNTVSSLPAPSDQAGRQAALGAAEAPAQPGLGGGGAAAPLPQATFAPAPTEAPAANAQQGVVNRLIIRDGTISVAVEDTNAAEKQIEGMVAQMANDGAFVVSTNESPAGSGSSPYINMVIRVPAAQFDNVMNGIAQLAAKGTTPTLTKTAQDVTSQYVDVKARLGALEAARDRLQQIMSQAQNTADLLQAEQQLTAREAEIEALQGQLNYLQQSAALSSITVTLQPYILSQPVDTGWHPGETLHEAVTRLLNSLRDFGDFLIIFVISVLPWLLVAGLVIYGIYRFVRGQVARTRSKAASSGSEEAH